ncbi:MAG: PilZ domain-containing protein [Desulfobacteraceae bacterium]|nr:PilZ domain-containing protein [Desulfobacteraceae bacterium]
MSQPQEKKPAASAERRKYPRISTSNEVNYVLLDQNRQRVEEGKGRTLNLSQSGALLETTSPLKGSFIILMTLSLDGEQVRVRGRVAYTREADQPGHHLTGVRFTGSKKEHVNAIVAFVKAYYHHKHNGQNKQGQQSAEKTP